MVKITEYAKNVAKSAGYAFAESTKDSYSNIAAFTETNAELFRSAYDGIRQRKTVAKRVATRFKESPAFEISSMFIKNAIEDIKTGDFYNQARVEDYETKYGGDLFSVGDFDLPELGFDPDGLDDLNFQDGDLLVSRSIVKSNKITSKAVASAMLRGSQAQIEANKEIASMLYTQNIELTRQLNNSVSTVNDNMVTGFKDVTSIAKTMSEQQAKFFTSTTETLDNINKNLESINEVFNPKKKSGSGYSPAKHTLDSVMGSSVDIRAYLNEVKTRGVNDAISQIPMIGAFLNPDFLKQMDTMMGGSMFRQAAANPMQAVMNAIVGGALPKSLKKSVEQFDASIGSLFPAFIGRMNSMSKDSSWSTKGTLNRMFGKLFGLDTDAHKAIKYQKLEGVPTAWDDTSKHYLEEVIPYYLRKMTAALTGEAEMVFDDTTGKWRSLNKVRKEFKDDIASQYRRPFSSSYDDFDSGVRRATSGMTFRNLDDEKQFEKDYDAFKKYVYKQGDINIKGKQARDLGMSSDRNLNIIRQAMLEMEPHMVMDLISEIQSNKASVTRKYKDITKGTALYKLFTEGEDLDFTGDLSGSRGNRSTVDRHLNNDKGSNFFNLGKLTDEYNKTIFDYLRLINGNIEFFKTNGMITYPQGIGNGGQPIGSNPNGPIIPMTNGRNNAGMANVPSGYFDRANATNARLVSNSDTAAAARDKQRAKDLDYHRRNVDYMTGRAGQIIVDSNTDMEEILANMQQTSAEERRKARQELEEEESLIDIFTEGAARRERNRDKFKELTSFKDKWAAASNIGERVFLVKDKLQSWIDAPSRMMEKAVLAADRHIFDLLYKTSTQMTDDNGQPVQGFMGLLKYKAMESFNTIKDTVTDIFGKAKDKLSQTKFGQWLANTKDRLSQGEASPLGKFKAAFKNEIGNIKGEYGNAFGSLADAFGYTDYREKLKAKRRAAAEEAALTPEMIGQILAFESAQDPEAIKKALTMTEEESKLHASAMNETDRARFERFRGNASKIASAKKLRDRYQAVVDDPNASTVAKKAAQRKLDEINKVLSPASRLASVNRTADMTSELNRIFNTLDTQNTINTTARATGNLRRELRANNDIINGGGTYATDEERQEAIEKAKERVAEINQQIKENDELIAKSVDELRSINEQRSYVEEQLKQASANADLINNLSINPFQAVFDAATKQREAFQNELTNAIADLDKFQQQYEQYNLQAVALHDKITDPHANYSPEELAQLIAERDELTGKAEEMRGTYIPQAKSLKARAQSRVNRANAKFNSDVEAMLKRFTIDSSVVGRLDSERSDRYDRLNSQYSLYGENAFDSMMNTATDDESSPVYRDANGQYRSRADRDKIREERDKYAYDLFSAEYGANLDPKTAQFLAQYSRNKELMKQFAASVQDPELKARFERIADGNYAYNEFGDIDSETRTRYNDITNASMFARGGRNKSSKSMLSIMSPNEKIITSGGSVYTVPKMGIYSIPGKSTVINPADDATIAKQAAAEKNFKRRLLTNARVNDGLSGTRVGEIAKGIGYQGLAKGAIGGIAGLLVGNPLLGAGIGMGSQLIQSNKVINQALFGSIIDYDENGNPIHANDGLIKESVQQALPSMKTGGLLGSVAGLLTPLGPVGGAIVGAGLGFLKNTKFVQDRLFGDGMLLSEDNRKAIKAAFPNVAIGAAAGALMGPFGLLGGALLGGGAGFLTTTEKFKSALLGEKNEDGEREGGVVGALKDNLVTPLKNFGLDLFEDIKENLHEDFLDPIKDAMAPITTELKNMFTFIPNMIADTFKEHISVPLANLVRDYVADPIKKLTTGILKKATSLIRLPFKLIGKGLFGTLGNMAKAAGIKNGRAGSYMTAAERNEFRQRHKSKFLVGDKYAEYDKNLAAYSETASVEDLELIKNSIAFNIDGERGLNKEIGNNSRAIGKKISEKFRTRFGNAARSIDRAIEQGKYEKAFDLIRNTKTVDGQRMSKEEADAFIAEVQQLLKQRDEILAKRDTYKATDEKVAEYASKLGIKKFNKKSAKQKRAIMDSLKAEINAKNAASIKYGSQGEAESRSADLQADIFARNAEAVEVSTNAFADFAAALKNVTKFMNGIGNFRNINDNAVYNNGNGVNMNQAIDIANIQNTFEDSSANRQHNLDAALDAADGVYDREQQRFLDTHVAKLRKFKLYSKITPQKFPLVFDVSSEDVIRLLNDMGDKGWFIDLEALTDFFELGETDKNKVYNIANFKFTGKKKFVFKKELLDTICTLTKRESAKLGKVLSEENVYILNQFKNDSVGLKRYISTLSNNKSKFKEFRAKAIWSASNNGMKRAVGRFDAGVRTVASKIPVLNEFASEEDREFARMGIQYLRDRNHVSIIDRLSSNFHQDDRRDDLIKKISETRFFKNDPKYSVKALKAMTTDELEAILRQIPTNAEANDGLSEFADDVLLPNDPRRNRPEAGSKEEAEAKKDKAEKVGIFQTMKNKISAIADFIIPKNDSEDEDESFFGKIKKFFGKVFGIGKLAVGVPLFVGAMAKWVIPFCKDKLVPWLVGEKDSSGNYTGGIASGVVNGIKNTVIPWVEDTALPKVKSVLGDLWSTGITTLRDDVLPTVMDNLIDRLPDILEGALVGAWEFIKSGAKTISSKVGFGKSGNKKAESSITSSARRATGTTDAEINESKLKREAYDNSNSNAFVDVAKSSVFGPLAENAEGVAINNANYQNYLANRGIGTQYLDENFAEEIAGNASFQSIRNAAAQQTNATGYKGKSLFQMAGRSFLNNAAGMGALGNIAGKTGAAIFKGVSKVPGLGIVGRLGEGAMNVINAPANVGRKFRDWTLKASGRAAANIATDVAEDAVETAATAAVRSAAGADKKAKLLAKVGTFLKNVLTKLFGNSKIVEKIAPLAKKVGMSKKALSERLAKTGEKLAANLAKKLGMESVEVLAKVLGKATVILAIAQAVLDFIAGWDNARNVLGIVDEEVSVFERFFAGLTNVISGLCCSIIPADFIANVLLDLFSFLGADFAKAIKTKQDNALEAIDMYNAENGTDFETVEDFNRAVNPTEWQKIKSTVKGWFTKADKEVESTASKTKVKTNAKVNDGLDPFGVDAVDSAIDEALATNAYANNKLSPLNMLMPTGGNFIDNLINSISGGNNITEQMARYESMNKSATRQIDDGKIKINDKRFWDINTGNDTTFAASLYKLSEFMRRAISSPLTIIQDAINSVFDTEASSATQLTNNEVSGTGYSVSHESMHDMTTPKPIQKTSTTTSKSSSKSTKKKGKIATFFSNLFGGKKKSGKGSEFKNRKLKYLIPPKPLDDEQASYIKSQYSGGANPHLYQRDYDDRFNISGDSNFQSIADSGCGPVVASEVLARRGLNYDVRDAARNALGYKERNAGTFPEFFGDYLGKNGVRTANVGTRSDLRRRLANGEDVILMGQSGRGTTPFGNQNAHYVLATGMKNNKIVVQDPEDPFGDRIYDANDTIRDSIYAISAGRGKRSGRGITPLSYRKGVKSGTGPALTPQQEKNLYTILHECIVSREAGTAGGYHAVCPNDNGSGISIGSIGFHATLAADVLRGMAARVSDADDKAYLLNIANRATSAISQSEADKLSKVLEKYESIAKDVQDNLAFKLYKENNMSHPLKLYNSGILQNPLSMIIPADIYNTGVHTGWADGWRPSHKGGKEEINDVVNRMATSSWWATCGSQYSGAWVNRIKDTGAKLANIDLNNYQAGTIFDGFSTNASIDGSSVAGDAGTTTVDNTFLGRLGTYVTKVMKKLYGGLYDAIFGAASATTGNAAAGVGALGDDDYLSSVSENGSDAWFLTTLEGASVSSGYRRPERPDHGGIDYAAPEGNKLYSPVDGTVVFAGWNTGGYGNLTIVQDTHGYYHIFGHQCQLPPVHEGDEVFRGTLVGYCGTTGESTGPHLHYQVNKPSDMWHADVDPNQYDYSDYIKSAAQRAGIVPSSNDVMGPLLPSNTKTTSNSSSAPTSSTVAGPPAPNKKSGKGFVDKALARQAANGKRPSGTCDSSRASGTANFKKVSTNAVTRAVDAVKRAEAKAASSTSGTGSTGSKYEPGARIGSNTKNTGGPTNGNATNEILLAVVKLLSEISGNTAKLQDVLAAVTKLSVSNACQLTGSGNNSKSAKSGKSNDTNTANVMAELSKALLASNGMTRQGLNAMNAQFNDMNNSEIIDAVYRIAKK